MKYLHYEVHLNPGEFVQVSLDKQANVRLLDDSNYRRYRRGERYRYYGGRATKSPINLRPPRSGRWNVVIDLGGYAGNIRAGVTTILG
jgi:hypothetical protein